MKTQKRSGKKEKIAHIIISLADGGAQGVLYRLAAACKEFDSVIISMSDEGKYGPLLKNQNIKVYTLGFKNVFSAPLASLKLVWFLFLERPAVVQTWMYHADLIGGIAARIVGCRRLFWGIRHSTLHPDESSKLTIRIAAFCARISKRIPKGIICCAYEAARVHEALGYDKEKLLVIQNGIDLERFSPDESKRAHVRRMLGVPKDLFVVGMVGRFDSQKDHRNLFKAMSLLKRKGKSFLLVLVGPDITHDNAELTTWIENTDLTADVVMLGSRPDVCELFNAFDLHVLPSSFGEGFPNVVAEAMAVGIPCVATDVGDAKSIVGETGWVVESGQSQELSLAIETAMLEHSQDRSKWVLRKAAGRSRISTMFSMEAMVTRYQDVWSSV